VTGGEALAGIIVDLATIVHSTFSDWVGVTYVADSTGSDLAFNVLAEGTDFAGWAADTLELWAALFNGIVHLPLITADAVNLLLVALG